MDSSKPKKMNRLTKIILVIVAVAAIILLGTITALQTSDGTEKFTGIQKHAAEHVINEAWRNASGINYTSIIGTIKITAENVVEDNSDSTFCNDQIIDNREGGANAYKVTLGHRTLFGILFDTTTYRVCRD